MRLRSIAAGAALGLTTTCVLCVGASQASPGTDAIRSTVTIKAQPNFHGRVKSGKAACVKARKVVVYRQMAGPDGVFADTVTDGTGRWHVDGGESLTGDFYARIRRVKVGSGSHERVCKGDRSAPVHVEPSVP